MQSSFLVVTWYLTVEINDTCSKLSIVTGHLSVLLFLVFALNISCIPGALYTLIQLVSLSKRQSGIAPCVLNDRVNVAQNTS